MRCQPGPAQSLTEFERNASGTDDMGTTVRQMVWPDTRGAPVGDDRTVALIADHSSPENSRTVLAQAITRVTGCLPVAIDARQFMVGGPGRVRIDDAPGLLLECDHTAVTPDVVFVYEID